MRVCACVCVCVSVRARVAGSIAYRWVAAENLAHYNFLSELKKDILDSHLKSKIEKIIANDKSTKSNNAYGNYLLAKYERKTKNYEKELNYLIEGHLNSFIFPLFVQQLIHAGFDCRTGKYLSTLENAFIVSKADNFEMSERLEDGYQWTEKHQNRSPIELKSSSVDVLFHNCQHIQSDLTLKLPKNYWSYGIDIRMPRWGCNFRI